MKGTDNFPTQHFPIVCIRYHNDFTVRNFYELWKMSKSSPMSGQENRRWPCCLIYKKM